MSLVVLSKVPNSRNFSRNFSRKRMSVQSAQIPEKGVSKFPPIFYTFSEWLPYILGGKVAA